MCTLFIFLLLFLTVLLAAVGYRKISLLVGSMALIAFLLIGDGFAPAYLLKHLQIYKEPQFIKWKNSNSIIILGAGTSKIAGSDEIIPSFTSFSRITIAAALYRRCKMDAAHCHILISGGDPLHNGKTEAAVYKNTLINLGINTGDIQLESNSRNTFENARYTSDLLKQKPDEQILLVSSGFALRRALLYFTYFNIYPTPIASDFITIPFTKLPVAYNLVINDLAAHEIVGIAQFYVYNFFGWNRKKLAH